MSRRSAIRASLLHCVDDPGPAADPDALRFFDDGVLIVDDGRISRIGPAAELLREAGGDVPVIDRRGLLLVPGFVDCHVHFPQIDIVASYGRQLLDWLENYAYPAEAKLADAAYAAAVAERFVDQLLRHGTTTALVFASVHPHSVDAVFDAALARNMRLLAGKVLMDRNCPEALRDDPQAAEDDSRRLIERWHGRARLGYAITPRFALTSSEEQLAAAGRLAEEFDDVHVHTHLAENRREITRVAELFPWSDSYLDVYDRFGLLRRRSVFAHCLHLDDRDRRTMAARNAAMAFCPGSNLFLGSGLFDLAAARDAGVQVGAGSDVGGGTTLNMLCTLGDGYKMLQLEGQSLPAYQAFYLATLGAARALDLDNRIGNLEPGKEADFVLLDAHAVPAVARRLEASHEPADLLFALMMLGDERAVRETWVMGEIAFGR